MVKKRTKIKNPAIINGISPKIIPSPPNRAKIVIIIKLNMTAIGKASLNPYPRSSISKNQPPRILVKYIKANMPAQTRQITAINAILSSFSMPEH